MVVTSYFAVSVVILFSSKKSFTSNGFYFKFFQTANNNCEPAFWSSFLFALIFSPILKNVVQILGTQQKIFQFYYRSDYIIILCIQG